MRNVFPIVAAATLAAVVTGCSNGATSGTPSVVPVNIAGVAKLQFAVGTATIAYPGGTVAGTNFVATFRGADGHSAVLSDTPTITGPPSFDIGYAPNLNSLTGVLPNVLSQAIMSAQNGGTFAPSLAKGFDPQVGVFGYGFADDNLLSAQIATREQALISNGGIPCLYINSSNEANRPSSTIDEEGSPLITDDNGNQVAATSEAQSEELGLPIGSGPDSQKGIGGSAAPTGCPVSTIVGIPAASGFPINYYGGPPAWPSSQGYGQPTFFIGYPVGFTDFSIAPVVGRYSLDVAYATNQSSSTYAHLDAAATLRSTTPLPPLSISSATATSGGTGSVTLTVPTGLYETIVFIRAADCDPSERPNAPFDNYAIVTHSTGTQNFIFSANLGPPNNVGQTVPTFCNTGAGNGINAVAFAVGFDYPAYESSYPFNVSQTPQITNANGQADVTTSAPFNVTGS